MYGIEFNGKHSLKNFSVPLAPGKIIGMPSKKKILINVPFANEKYDFSEIYGSQTYSERELVYPLSIVSTSKDRMNFKKTEIINWLMNSNGKQKLYDDTIPGYYFLAEVETDPSFSENRSDGILTVTFQAYPFMIAHRPEGHDIWDEINFDLDVLQPVNFMVNGLLEVTLLNVGTNDLKPKITSSSSMQVELRQKVFNVRAGESQSRDFILKSGENDLKITGNGSISFEFYKELI